MNGDPSDEIDALLEDSLPPPEGADWYWAEACEGRGYPPARIGAEPVFAPGSGIDGLPLSPPDSPWNRELRRMVELSRRKEQRR